jgi:hypothetical protein
MREGLNVSVDFLKRNSQVLHCSIEEQGIVVPDI